MVGVLGVLHPSSTPVSLTNQLDHTNYIPITYHRLLASCIGTDDLALNKQYVICVLDGMSSTPTSQASTSEVDSQVSTAHNQTKSPTKPPQKSRHSSPKEAAISRDIFLFLIAFRILNALSIKTFFQPDEFFQSLDPAWEIAFGRDSGAWISWVGFPTPK